MQNFKQTLNEKIPRTPLKLWHVLLLLSLLWVAPIFLPDAVWYDFWAVFVAAWLVLYWGVNRLIAHAMRVTKIDVILIERFFIMLSFLVPAIIATFYGVRNGFDTLITIICITGWLVVGMLVLGIVLHIKNAHKYYHGVKKDELFK